MKEVFRYTFCAGFLFCLNETKAQCPDNLGFEDGNFKNWVCSIGHVDQSGIVHMTENKIDPARHKIIDANLNATDTYGRFPLKSPNGSKYVLKLGNDNLGAQAERVSYTFTVPAGRNDYAIVYHYAVVFQSPVHFPFQQPRFNVSVFDVVTNQYIPCSTSDFIASSGLPGFTLSDVIVGQSPNIYYKPWAQASVKLTGYAGKTIRLDFTTNDCIGGDHFGYAYIDINTECNTIITGNIYCAGNTAVGLQAPFGFEKYSWYDADLNNLLDTNSLLTLKPLPSDGSKYALVVKPYNGTGCPDTLFTTVKFNPVPFHLSVADSANFCSPSIGNLTAPWITGGSTHGLNYVYYTDSTQTHYLQSPDSIWQSGTYYIQAYDRNGCVDAKPIKISVSPSPKLLVASPVFVDYPATVDLSSSSVILSTTNDLSLSYWKDAGISVSLPNYNFIANPGIYYIKAMNHFGCFDIKPVEVVVSVKPPNTFSPNDDGVHDRWEIAGLNKYQRCDVNIYNRWGQLVYHSIGYNVPWDGTLNGNPLPAATYYFLIKLTDSVKPVSGFVDIIR